MREGMILVNKEELASLLDDLLEWADYTPDYFKEKHNLEKDRERVRKMLGSTERRAASNPPPNPPAGVRDELASSLTEDSTAKLEYAGWLADKICIYGDYAKEAAIIIVRQAKEIEHIKILVRKMIGESE